MLGFKNLIVCGDSFNTPSVIPKFAGTHWSEYLSKMLDVNLINLSSIGCSNRMIVMQAEEAMKYEDSLIIIAPAANFLRIELLTERKHFLNDNISFKNFQPNPELTKTPDAFIRSVNTSVFDHDNTLSNDVKKALLENIPFGFYRHIDKWALYYMLSELKKKRKNFLFVETVVLPPLQILSYAELKELVGAKHIIPRREFSYQYYVDRAVNKTFEDPGYHTTPKCQELSAQILFKIIKERSKTDK